MSHNEISHFIYMKNVRLMRGADVETQLWRAIHGPYVAHLLIIV
jgi:hypothetical protein